MLLAFGMPGGVELLVILGALILFFGAKRIPQMGSALGKGIKNFKSSVSGEDEEPAKLPEESSTPKDA